MPLLPEAGQGRSVLLAEEQHTGERKLRIIRGGKARPGRGGPPWPPVRKEWAQLDLWGQEE